ncbi:DUF1661 domain-containing protein [Porphyromonas gulae]|uniref:DUF1661 domain-containing protein n=1 Tax=Porphyromonas gulae TaxID=111105 RepID=UPI00374304A8
MSRAKTKNFSREICRILARQFSGFRCVNFHSERERRYFALDLVIWAHYNIRFLCIFCTFHLEPQEVQSSPPCTSIKSHKEANNKIKHLKHLSTEKIFFHSVFPQPN